MRRIVIAGLFVILVAPLAVAQSQGRAKDEEAIKKVFTDFGAAWAKDDAKGMASFWTEDGDLINPAGRVANGRAEVEKLFEDEHASTFKGTQITFSGGTVRFVKSGVAIYTVNWEVPGAHGPDGKEMTLKGVVTSVMVKKNGKWWTLAVRAVTPAGQM